MSLNRHFVARTVALIMALSIVASCKARSTNRQAESYQEPDLFDTSKNNLAPQPEIIMPDRFNEADKVHITVQANDQDAKRLVYLYDFDGNGVFDYVGAKRKLTHIWNQHGVYKLHVRVQDERGGVGDAYKRLVVVDRAPKAAFSKVGRANEGSWVTLDAKASTSPSDPILRYQWDWQYNGKSFRPSKVEGRRVENRWVKSGDYTVALKVTDADGSAHVTSKLITIADLSPVPKISGPKELLVGEKARFSAAGSRSVVDKIIGYYWDTAFDGSFTLSLKGSHQAIAKSWSKPGAYRIAVQVKDADGSVAMTTHDVRVLTPEPADKPADKSKKAAVKQTTKKRVGKTP